MMTYKAFKFFLIFGICFFGALNQAAVIEKVLAVVDDEMISLSYLKSYQKLLKSKWADSSILFSIHNKKSLLKDQKKLLNYLIDIKILMHSLSPEILENVSDSQLIRKKIKQKGTSKKNLERDLRKIGLTLDEYRNILYQNSALQTAAQFEISSFIQILDHDINDHYLEKKGRPLFTKYQYEFHEFKFELSEKGKKRAQEFLVKKNFEDKKPKLRSMSQDQMQSQIKKIISKLSAGQFSKPLCLSDGCYVFELLNKSFIMKQSKKIQDIRSKLFDEKFSSQIKIWVEDNKKKSVIKKYI